MRIGIFGGSFDPIHLGHLILAEQCRQAARLDQVWLIPCAQQPLKQQPPIASNRQRCEMIELAIAGCQAFYLSKLEIERGEISYTVDTLKQIRLDQPDDELFFLIGADSLAQFANWKSPAEICELATPIIFNRPGESPIDLKSLSEMVPEKRMSEIADHQITSRLIDISSTEIRNRIAAKESIRFLLPRAVEKYIETQNLYSTTG